MVQQLTISPVAFANVHMARHGTAYASCESCVRRREQAPPTSSSPRLEGLTTVPAHRHDLGDEGGVIDRSSVPAPTQPSARAPPMPFLALETFRAGSPVRADAMQSRRRGEGRSGVQNSIHGRHEITKAG